MMWRPQAGRDGVRENRDKVESRCGSGTGACAATSVGPRALPIRYYMASMTVLSAASSRISNPLSTVTCARHQHGSPGADAARHDTTHLCELDVVLVELLLHDLLQHAEREDLRLLECHLLDAWSRD